MNIVTSSNDVQMAEESSTADNSVFKCWYTNATSLNKDKLDELRIMISQSAPDIVFITETWWQNEGSEIDLEGYKCFRKDREKNEKHGGVCIYVRVPTSDTLDALPKLEWKTKLKACVCSIDDDKHECEHTENKVEQVWCLLTTKDNVKFLLGCIYRQVKDETIAAKAKQDERDKEINKIIKELGALIRDKKINGIILAGDFNFNNIKWKLESAPSMRIVPTITNGTTQQAKDFIKAIKESELNQNINFKTFIKTLNSDTLDLVFTDTGHIVSEVKQDNFLGNPINGHIGISWRYKIPINIKLESHKRKRENNTDNSDLINPLWLGKIQERNKQFEIMAKAYDMICKYSEELQSVPKFKPAKIGDTGYLWFNNRLYCNKPYQLNNYFCRNKGCTANFDLLDDVGDIEENTYIHNEETHISDCKIRNVSVKYDIEKCIYFYLKSRFYELIHNNCYFQNRRRL